MSSKPDKQSYKEDIEDSKKNNPGQGRQGQPNQPGQQRKDESNQPDNRSDQPRGGKNR